MMLDDEHLMMIEIQTSRKKGMEEEVIFNWVPGNYNALKDTHRVNGLGEYKD